MTNSGTVQGNATDEIRLENKSTPKEYKNVKEWLGMREENYSELGGYSMIRLDYVLYVEHRVRELGMAILINYYLNQFNINGVILPVHFNKYKNLVRYYPKLVAFPFCYSRKNEEFQRCSDMYGDLIQLNLHQEQITTKEGQEYMLPSDDYSRDVYHIAWGCDFAKRLVASGVKPYKIFITGSPRHDLFFVQKRLTKSDVGTILGIDSSKPWILVAENFSAAFSTDDYINKIADNGFPTYKKNLKLVKKSRDKFVQIIFAYAKNNPDVQIIYRPHPMVSISSYKELFSNLCKENLPNLIILREYSVNTWFNLCDSVITWTSTTALEAASFGKRVVLLHPAEVPSNYDMEWLKFFPIAHDLFELDQFLKASENNDNERLSQYLKKTYGETDGLASLRIALAIRYLLQSVQLNQKIVLKEYIKNINKAFYVDMTKYCLMKMNLLHKLKPFYAGLLDDYLSSNIVECEREQMDLPQLEATIDCEIDLTRYGYIFKFV